MGGIFFMKNRILLGLIILPYTFISAVLIPREELFQPPTCLGIKISPDARQLAYIGADHEGTMNLYLTPHLSLENAKKITDFTEPQIKNFYWMPDNKKIILLKDSNGTGKFHLYSIELDSLKIKDLTATYENSNTKVIHVGLSESKAIVGINNRNSNFHDLYLLDLTTDKFTQIYQNDQFINFLFDDDLNLVLKVKMNEDGSLTLFDKNDLSLFSISADDAFHTECLEYNKKENAFYLIDNRGCNTTQLKKIYLDGSKNETLLGHDLRSDITSVYFEKNEPVAYSTYFTHQEWHPLNKTMESDIHYLISKVDRNFEIVDQSCNDRWWIIKNNIPDKGIAFWLYDRSSRQLSLLYSFPNIDQLGKMHPLLIPSRDGLQLVSYLTLPKDCDQNGKPHHPLPLVVIPHGGPFKARDFYDYSPAHQFLANRGYAVLCVNFRLSSGFGKDFVNGGNGQWGKKAHEDILDAVAWCIDSKIAEPGKIGVFGGSYGGYEALASLTFSPDTFACAISICGPSNLKTVLDTVPFYWEFPSAPLSDKMVRYTKNAFIKSMGGAPDEENGIAYLQSCSPLNHVDNIKKPLLLIHGENDPIVKAAESDQIFTKMEQKQLPVLYLSFPDEGHGIRKFKNSMCYLAYAEWFLAQILGGNYEPITDEQVKASSAIIKSCRIIR